MTNTATDNATAIQMLSFGHCPIRVLAIILLTNCIIDSSNKQQTDSTNKMDKTNLVNFLLYFAAYAICIIFKLTVAKIQRNSLLKRKTFQQTMQV